MNIKIRQNVPAFLSYLQKRMDFIAQVATSAPSWCMITNCNNLISHFNGQYCLTSNIIRSHQGVQGGVSFEPLFEQKYDNAEGRAPELDIPHGQVGAQAFYTILENLVRNTAKYGDAKQLDLIKTRGTGDGKLRFTISVKVNWDDGGTGWANDYYKVKIIDQLKTQDSPGATQGVVANLNRFLADPLTDPITGVVKPKHWGMKEIKICAAYLRMVKQDEIDLKFEQWDQGQGAQPPIIKVNLENIERREGQVTGNLTYTFYLLRPKRVLVVMTPPAPGVQEHFRRSGVDFYSPADFKTRIDQGESPRHWFLALPKPASPEEWSWLAAKLNFIPPRVIIFDGSEDDIPEGRAQLRRSLAFMPTPALKTPAMLVAELGQHWVQKWWGDFEIFVRWSKYKSTIADRGGTELEDEWKDIPAETQKKWLVFDHRPGANESKLFALAAYHESLDSESPTARMLERRAGITAGAEEITTETLEKESRFRVKETAAVSVAIIDERVWLEKDGAATHGVKKYKGEEFNRRLAVWAKRRVFLQDTNFALRDFNAFLDALNPPDGGFFDFVIIHQGIIDGVKDRMTSKEFLAVWLKLRSKARWLVVDSGRGQPEQAREGNLRWVEYSNLAECLIQYAGDKFRLAELLWTLRASAVSGATG